MSIRNRSFASSVASDDLVFAAGGNDGGGGGPLPEDLDVGGARLAKPAVTASLMTGRSLFTKWCTNSGALLKTTSRGGAPGPDGVWDMRSSLVVFKEPILRAGRPSAARVAVDRIFQIAVNAVKR